MDEFKEPFYPHKFVSFRDSLRKERRGEKVMFDVPAHYKWLDEQELFNYWINLNRK